MNICLTQKEWTELIHKCLEYLNEKDPQDPSLFKTERQVLPGLFTESQGAQYCYAYKGVFLPSGNLDGIVWKPSQGAKPTGKGLMKRYFYYKKDEVKINRQVIWLSKNENWCFIDYRYNFKGKIRLSDAQLPSGFDFAKLVKLSWTSTSSSVPLAISCKESSRKRKEIEPSSPYLGEINSEELPLFDSDQFSSPLPETDLDQLELNMYNSLDGMENMDIKVEDDFLSYGSCCDEHETLFPCSSEQNAEYDSIVETSKNLLPFFNYNIFGSKSDSDILEYATKKRKITPTYTQPSFFSSPFEYFFDMISNMICVQIMFKRRFFRRFETTMTNYNALLEKIKQDCVTVDLSEFPGKIVTNFFGWLSENFCQTSASSLPTIYCLVCGLGNGEHDQKAHQEFFKNMDQSFVSCLQEKGKNLPELVKLFITFLLKNPSSHQSFGSFIANNLHCPFCSMKHGNHCEETHQQWKAAFKLDPQYHYSTGEKPEPASNITDSAKSTFGWLMGHVPAYIPPFLLSFHYVKYVQSFLDCLVTIYQSIRLL